MLTVRSARFRANLLIVCTAAIWGFAFAFQRLAAEHMDSFAFNGVRFALGAGSLLPLIAWTDHRAGRSRSRRRQATRSALLPGTLAGLVLYAASGLQQVGLTSSTAGEAAFISGLYMVIVPVLGLALGMRASWCLWPGVALACAGLYLLSVTDSLSLAPGDAVLLLGAVFWAVHILVIDRYAPLHDVLRFAAIQCAVCSAASLLTSAATEPGGFAGAFAAVIPLLYAGPVSVGLAYTLQVVAQRHVRPADAALIFSTEAVFGVIGGALFLGENLGARGYLGCSLMLAGIVLAQFDPRAAAPGRQEREEALPPG